MPETETADALAAMQTAERAHAELLIAKYAAIGKRVGMWAPELEGDAEIDASYDAMTAAQRAYERACSRDRRRGHS